MDCLSSLVLHWGVPLAILAATIYLYIKSSFSYWTKRGVPISNPTVPFGNFAGVLVRKEGIINIFDRLYKEFEGHKVGGLYSFVSPSILIRDPDIIKDILLKDFAHFYSRGIKIDEENEPLQGHLFALSGSKWRNLRVKMSPTFTSGKMKVMFDTLAECGKELQTCLQSAAGVGDTVEIKDVLARYSTDIIASVAFGIQCNCLKDPNAEFRQWGRRIFQSNYKNKLIRILSFVLPVIFGKFRGSLVPSDVKGYFMKMVRDTVEYREKNNVKRNDFMQLMIQLKNKTLGVAEGEEENVGKIDDGDLKANAPFEVTMDVIAAQAFVFFLAGFETSSTTMTFCLYELAMNQHIQKRLQSEIDTILEKHDGKVTYEAVFEMEYLDKVVNETLRKYPPVAILTRECMKTAKISGTNVVIEKGTKVMIPVNAIQNDPKYYPDPEIFNPERFNEEEKKKRHHYCYLPFGEGPRICIGMRFGLMQTKVGLISLLSKYEVHVTKKTTIPIKFDPKSGILSPFGGMWLKITNRRDTSS